MTVNEFLPIVLYILGSILLVILIILGIKLINMLDKMEKVVDDINTKVNSLNGFFNLIDATTDKLSMLSDRMVDGVSSLIKKIFGRKKRKEESEDYE